jgi:SAM-dependent methyltransferase
VDGLDPVKEMLNTARQCAEQDGIQSIGWHEGDASRMPFDGDEYDVVLCQQGLQFFSDRTAALREMARVLVPGGRLAISVWRAIDRCPFLAVLANVIGSYLGVESTALMHASCSLADREELRALLSNAGFRDLHIRLESRVARYAPFSEFLSGYLSVLPVFPAIASMPDPDRADMFQRISASLYNYMDDGGLAAPMESYVATANK